MKKRRPEGARKKENCSSRQAGYQRQGCTSEHILLTQNLLVTYLGLKEVVTLNPLPSYRHNPQMQPVKEKMRKTNQKADLQGESRNHGLSDT